MHGGTLRSVLYWCLPTYLFVGITLAMMHFRSSLAFNSLRPFDEIWMTIAALLPIFTIVACVKAAALRLTWRPVLGWGLAAVAFALNALCYRVIADTLR